MNGYLERRGRFKNYQKKFFQYENCELSYFTDRNDQIPKATYSLIELSDVKLNPDHDDFRFSLHFKNRVIHLRADDREVLQAWIESCAIWIPCKKVGDPLQIPWRFSSSIQACLDYACKSNTI